MFQTLMNLVFEIARFLGALWSKAWRKIFHSRKTFFTTLGIVIFAGLVWTIAGSAINPKADRPVTTPTATDRPVTYTEIKVQYADEGSTETPELQESNGQQTSGDPATGSVEKPKFDKESAESVAKGVVQSYVIRPTEQWNDWEEWVKPHMQPELLMQLQGTVADGSASHDYPVAVTKIHVEPAADSAPRDTPIRWSRTIRVETAGKSGSGEIKLNVAAALGEEGWVVTEMIQVED